MIIRVFHTRKSFLKQGLLSFNHSYERLNLEVVYMVPINKNTLKKVCDFFAKSLPPHKPTIQSVQHPTDITKLDTKYILNVDTKRFWKYLKPNFDVDDIESITEYEAILLGLTSEQLDTLILCDGLGYSFSDASAILNIENMQDKYQQAVAQLSPLMQDCDEFGEEKSSNLNSELKHNVFLSIGLFILIDIIAIIVIMVTVFWGKNVDTVNPSDAQTNTQFEITLNNTQDGLYYDLSYLPDGYIKSKHSTSPLLAQTVYSNDGGQEILFTQQVSEKKITEFDNTIEHRLLVINNRKTAIYTKNSQTFLYWYNGRYAYSLTGAVSEDELIKIAQNIEIEPSPAPYQYDEYLATENGDILTTEITADNIKRLHEFNNNYTNGVHDIIRICEVTEDGVVLITAEIIDNKVYYTKDARRSDYDEQVFETGILFDELYIADARGGKQSLMLRSSVQQITLIQF